MPSHSPDQISSLLDKQRSHYAAGHTRDISNRIEILGRFQEALEKSRDEVLVALAEDLGKPPLEAFLAEYYFLLGEVRSVRKSLKKWLKPQRAGSPVYFLPCRNRIHLEPHGLVLIISPWNYPFQLALSPMLAAIAAGNTVVLKPSEDSPATSAVIRRLVVESFPAELVAVVEGDADVTSELLEHPFDFLFFTGSTRVGRIIAEKAARHLTPTILELGGKCPCVVESSADFEIAARRILFGKLFNAGQTCFAPDFVAVHRDDKEQLLAELIKCLEAHPWEDEMARIIHQKHYEHLQGMLEEGAYSKGEDDAAKLHFAPRILQNSDWDSPAMKDEVFGPILPIVTFDDEAELFEKLAQYPSPLALYAFSKDERFVDRLLTRIPSGGACLNDVGKHASNLKLPFGGKGDSGHGRYRGKFGVAAFSYQRAVTKRYFLPDPFESLPPRGKQFELLKKWMR